jgi:hypothetical protein
MRCVGFVSTGRTAELLAEADLVIHSLEELDSKVVERLLENGQGRENGNIGDSGCPR